MNSALGEPLDATVALTVAPDTKPRRDCFSLGRAREAGLPAVPRATLAVEPDGAGWRLRIRTRAVIGEPAFQLRLRASCDAKEAAARDYEILLDPRPAEAPPPAFRSLPGDTLASIATAIYPKNRVVREAYVRALRTANPALAGLAPDAALPSDTQLVLPGLRRFSMSLAVSPVVEQVRLPVAKPRAVAVPTTSASPVTPSTETSPPTPRSSTASTKADKPKPPTAIPDSAAPKGGQFVLRLSASEVDLSRSRGIDDRMRAQLRERLLVLDADDQVAALLAIRSNLKQLEGRVAELQLKLSVLPAGAQATPEPAPKATTPPKPAPDKAAAPAAKVPVPRSPEPKPAAGEMALWLWGVLALLAIGVATVVWRVLSRTRARPPASVFALDGDNTLTRSDAGDDSTEPAVREHRIVADSDANLATRVTATAPLALRRRYIEERFPEITNGTIALDEPDSVVKAARLFYEDGALARAVELLQFAVDDNPAAMKPWLALFEIFRLEGLSGEFAQLAGRFREYHGSSDNWRKVQHIGREIDAPNPLFLETPLNNLGTIGHPAPRGGKPITFDPLAENWLNAPMDFTNDALAASLRAGLLADAGVSDHDLVADPMSALKNIEMFNVA